MDYLRAEGQEVEEAIWDCDRISQLEWIGYSNCVIETIPMRTILNGNTKLEYDPNHRAFMTLRGFFSGKVLNPEMR